jgi:endonuclease G, mitochondrial
MVIRLRLPLGFPDVTAGVPELMKNMLNSCVALAVSLLLCATVWAGPSACPEHFQSGQAPDIINQKIAARTTELCNTGFVELHSGVTRTPLYSAEHLTGERLLQGRGLKRVNSFHSDDRLPPSERAELADYARSGYDRGHIAPSGDMFDPQSQHESFSLANMIPQEPSVNRGVWERIESGVRRMVKTRGELFVVTGPLFQGADLKRIGGRVLVPSATFKAMYDPNRKEAGAYVVGNAPGAMPQVVSIAELNSMAGLDIFPGLSAQAKSRTMRLPVPNPRKARSH